MKRIAFLFTLFAATSLFAETEAEKNDPITPSEAFDLRDADKNGALTWDEYLKYRVDTSDPKLRKRFDKRDKDKNSELSREEFLAGKK